MAKNKIEHIVEKVTLIKVENDYMNRTETFVYSLNISGLSEDLIIESNTRIKDVVGLKFDYQLDSKTNEVSDFNFY